MLRTVGDNSITTNLDKNVKMKSSVEICMWENSKRPQCWSSSANKAANSGFEIQRRHHQKSETGVSAVPQKGHVSTKI